jgi:hypothetical protein
MRFFSYGDILRTLQPLPQDLPALRRRIIAAISQIDRNMLQWLWVEMDYRLDVGSVTKDGHVEHLDVRKKQIWTVFLSICRPPVTILSAIQLYRFHEGIMNNPVYTDLVHTSPVKGRTSIRQTNWRILCLRVFVRLTQNIQMDSIGKIKNF